MKDGKYMEQGNWKEYIRKQIGKPVEIVYERTKEQFDHRLCQWVKRTIFIRVEKGKRDYGSLSKFDKLLLIGIFNHSTKEWQEFAYNDNDQEALFKQVFFNFRSLKERRRLIEQLENIKEEQKNHTLPIILLPHWIYQEQEEE